MPDYSTNPMRRLVKSNAALFNSGEHLFIGDHIKLSFPDGKPQSAPPRLRLLNELRLTYGEIAALGGDFYGIPQSPISSAPDPDGAFLNAFATLSKASEAVQQAPAIIDIMKNEIRAVQHDVDNGVSYYDAYAKVDNDGDYNVATGGGSFFSKLLPTGRYLQLAEMNFDHFGKNAMKAYTAGHTAATRVAAGSNGDIDQLECAYAMNAFADHFLSDLFSSGHLRTPRAEIHAAGSAFYQVTKLYDLLSKYMHDEESYWGLNVQNRDGETWKSFGDTMLFEDVDGRNKEMVIAAVQQSADEIYAAFISRSVPDPSQPKALSIAPSLDVITSDRGPPNKSPLFIVDQFGILLRRTNVDDVNSYDWTRDWTVPTSLVLLEESIKSRMPHR